MMQLPSWLSILDIICQNQLKLHIKNFWKKHSLFPERWFMPNKQRTVFVFGENPKYCHSQLVVRRPIPPSDVGVVLKP